MCGKKDDDAAELKKEKVLGGSLPLLSPAFRHSHF